MKPSAEIQRQAAHWLVWRDRGDLTPEDCARFESWLAENSQHRAAYLELEATWRQSDALSSWRSAEGRVNPSILQTVSARRRSLLRWRPAVAAALAVVLIGGVGWFFAIPARQATYVTDIGGYQRVALRDGSVMQLNTDTEVRVELRTDRREVRLVRGEASFEVAQDSKRPFEVIARGTAVHAVGTAFTVRLVEDAVEVVVTEGRVAVRPDVSVLRLGEQTPPPTSSISAGESAIARSTGVAVSRVPAQEVTRRLAWQEGELSFRGEPLIRAIDEFNRYNRVRIEIVDPALAPLEIGGNFRATDPESFVRALESVLPVRAHEIDGVIRLTARQ